jgi:hypothetical protein
VPACGTKGKLVGIGSFQFSGNPDLRNAEAPVPCQAAGNGGNELKGARWINLHQWWQALLNQFKLIRRRSSSGSRISAGFVLTTERD